MQFVDEVTIEVRAGDGGRGLTSFRREKFIPKGGPDGGDGGSGGSVYLRVEPSLNHLGGFIHQRTFTATSGESGASRCSSGAQGPDLYINVPSGTLVYEAETHEFIGELLEPDASLLVACGGQRGFGNPHFKSSINRTPRRSTPGTPGETRTLKLELRLVADIGLIGKPNAGKSSLLNFLTNAQAKVGDYMFTTINPVLGVIREEYDSDYLGYTLADIPGLIEGASRGEGLGFFFLRHVSRTHLLLHLVDASADDLFEAVEEVEHNLFEYDGGLRTHPRWLVLSKCDLLEPDIVEEKLQQLRSRYQIPCYTSSAQSGAGTAALVEDMTGFVSRYRKQ